MKTKLLPNGLMVIDGDQWLSAWVEASGKLCCDRTVIERIVPRLKPGQCIVDVGASLGDHTAAYAEVVGQAGRVFAFEPHPLSFECLRHNMAPYPQVSCINRPLSDGFAKLVLQQCLNVGASYLMPMGRNESGDICLPMTLDDVGLDRLDFLKIDAEGMELKVLRGGEGTLRGFRPLIFIELNRGALARQDASPERIVAYLAGLDYRIEFLDPSHSLDMEQVDVFFCPL